MTAEDANKLVEVLKGYFPQMTVVLQAGARKELESRDLTDELKAAMAEYVRTEDRFVLASFLRAITPVTNVGEALATRTQRELAAANAQATAVARQWAEADAFIDRMSDGDLVAAVEQAFLNLDVDAPHLVRSERAKSFNADGTVNRFGLTRLVKAIVASHIVWRASR